MGKWSLIFEKMLTKLDTATQQLQENKKDFSRVIQQPKKIGVRGEKICRFISLRVQLGPVIEMKLEGEQGFAPKNPSRENIKLFCTNTKETVT